MQFLGLVEGMAGPKAMLTQVTSRKIIIVLLLVNRWQLLGQWRKGTNNGTSNASTIFDLFYEHMITSGAVVETAASARATPIALAQEVVATQLVLNL